MSSAGKTWAFSCVLMYLNYQLFSRFSHEIGGDGQYVQKVHKSQLSNVLFPATFQLYSFVKQE